jgi:hypothetical protein
MAFNHPAFPPWKASAPFENGEILDSDDDDLLSVTQILAHARRVQPQGVASPFVVSGDPPSPGGRNPLGGIHLRGHHYTIGSNVPSTRLL